MGTLGERDGDDGGLEALPYSWAEQEQAIGLLQ